MSKTIATDFDNPNRDVPEATAASAAMHRPKHGVLDTLETAALDEVQHEAALRDSALRPPR